MDGRKTTTTARQMKKKPPITTTAESEQRNVYFEKWFLVRTEKEMKRRSSNSVINVAAESGKDRLSRLIISKDAERNNNNNNCFLNFVIVLTSRGEDKSKVVSVRNILMDRNRERFDNNPEDEEFVRLLRTFIITYDNTTLV